MDISQSARSAELAGRIREFMAEHIYPNERRFYQEAERLGPWAVHPVVEELKPLARDAGPVEPVPARARSGRPRPISNMRRCARSWAARIWRLKCSTAARPTPATWRPSCATVREAQKEQLAEAAARRRDPLVFRDDRARRRLVGRHQHRELDRARRRRLCHQRPQVVHDRRDRSALQDHHLHGSDRSRTIRIGTGGSR